MFCFLHRSPDRTSLDVSCIHRSLVRTPSTPQDSYIHFYLECWSLEAASNIISITHYSPSYLTMVPVEARETLLQFRLDERIWIRLPDRLLGFVLARDKSLSEHTLVIAAPSRHASTPSTKKARRLYNVHDMLSYVKQYHANRFLAVKQKVLMCSLLRPGQ